jgi:hypothetical protein
VLLTRAANVLEGENEHICSTGVRMTVLEGANPTELSAPINPEGGPVERHRNLTCLSYDSCLDKAVIEGWNSFSCVRCPHFTPPAASLNFGKPDLDEFYED